MFIQVRVTISISNLALLSFAFMGVDILFIPYIYLKGVGVIIISAFGYFFWGGFVGDPYSQENKLKILLFCLSTHAEYLLLSKVKPEVGVNFYLLSFPPFYDATCQKLDL